MDCIRVWHYCPFSYEGNYEEDTFLKDVIKSYLMHFFYILNCPSIVSNTIFLFEIIINYVSTLNETLRAQKSIIRLAQLSIIMYEA